MASPWNLLTVLLWPGAGLVKVIADPVELISKSMKGVLILRVELLKQVLLVEDSLKVLNCGAYFLVKDPNNFLSWPLLEVRECTQGRWALGQRFWGQGGGRCNRSREQMRLYDQENVRSEDQEIGSVGVGTDLSLRSRQRINFLQMVQRPTGKMILQCLGHFRM